MLDEDRFAQVFQRVRLSLLGAGFFQTRWRPLAASAGDRFQGQVRVPGSHGSRVRSCNHTFRLLIADDGLQDRTPSSAVRTVRTGDLDGRPPRAVPRHALNFGRLDSGLGGISATCRGWWAGPRRRVARGLLRCHGALCTTVRASRRPLERCRPHQANARRLCRAHPVPSETAWVRPVRAAHPTRSLVRPMIKAAGQLSPLTAWTDGLMEEEGTGSRAPACRAGPGAARVSWRYRSGEFSELGPIRWRAARGRANLAPII